MSLSKRPYKHRKSKRFNNKSVGGVGSLNIPPGTKLPYSFEQLRAEITSKGNVILYRGVQGFNFAQTTMSGVFTVGNSLISGVKAIGNVSKAFNYFTGKQSSANKYAQPVQQNEPSNVAPIGNTYEKNTLGQCYYMVFEFVDSGKQKIRMTIDFSSADQLFLKAVPVFMVIDGLNVMTGFGHRTAIKNAMLQGKAISTIDNATIIVLEFTDNEITKLQITSGGGARSGLKTTIIIDEHSPSKVCGILSLIDRALYNFSRNNKLLKQIEGSQDYQILDYTARSENCNPILEVAQALPSSSMPVIGNNERSDSDINNIISRWREIRTNQNHSEYTNLNNLIHKDPQIKREYDSRYRKGK